ncbi:MAG: histidine kinase [Alphaproteobacteria bacterium]|jgi:GAF domain-containing protein|nr:histidine kinase [Alphaproteobacteria bacterium]
MPHEFQADIDAIAAIPAVPRILEVICRTTGMRFAAIARVTDERWVCCASKDDLAFGLVPGSELWLETTICEEIRGSRVGVAIDHVAENPEFRDHPTPAMYGFQSYISMPITLADGSFYGTLCSIDPHPNTLNNPTVTGMFKLFAELIAFHLDAHHKLAQAERDHARRSERFKAGLGHDMRNALAAIEAGTRLLAKTPLNERGALIVREMQASAEKLAQQVAEATKD